MFPHMHRLVSCVLALLLATAALLLSAGPASAGEGGTIKRLANAARADAGRGPLARDSDLDVLARKWAHKMAADGSLSHNPDLSEQVPEGWQGVGENVAMGYPTGAEMHRGWMNSDGHRANILGDYTHIGIAFVVVDGTSWGVQVFAKYPPGVRPTAKPKPSPRAPNAPASTNAPAKAPTKAPPQTPRSEQSATEPPAPSRTPSASVSASQSPSPSPSGSPSASTSESADAVPYGDSETAGPVTFTDVSKGPGPGASGLFGIGWVEMAVGMLALSGLGLLAALFLARRRRRREQDALPARHVRPAGPYPGGPVPRGQAYPVARPVPGRPDPRRPSPGRPLQGRPVQRRPGRPDFGQPYPGNPRY